MNKSSIFWCLFQKRSLLLSPTIPLRTSPRSIPTAWNSRIWHLHLNNTLLPRRNVWNLVFATSRPGSMKLTCQFRRFLARTVRPVMPEGQEQTCQGLWFHDFYPSIWPKTVPFRGLFLIIRFSTFCTKTHFSWKPKKLTKSNVRIGDEGLVQNSAKHPQRASEVSEENSCMILFPRVSLPQNMEEGCFFRLFIMTQNRAWKDTEKLERGKGRDGLRWMSLYRCLFMPVRQTKGSAQLVGFYKIIND